MSRMRDDSCPGSQPLACRHIHASIFPAYGSLVVSFFFFLFPFFNGVGIYIDTMPLCQCPSNAKRDMISNFTTSMRTRSLQMLIVGFGGFISMQLGLKRWRKAGTKPSLGLPPIKNVFSDNVCINNKKNTSLGLLCSKTSSMFTFLCVQRFSPHTSRTALPSPFKPYDHVVKIITRKKIYAVQTLKQKMLIILFYF